MKRIIRHVVTCAIIAGLAVPMSAMATNGYFAHGYGTKNKALAGGGVALPQDAMIAATNPAGMALVGDRMDIGMAVFSPTPRSYTTTGDLGITDGTPCSALGAGGCPFQIGPQSVESDNDFFAIPHFAYNWQLPGDRTFGVAMYGNGGMNTEYDGGTASHDDGSAFPGPGNYVTVPGTFGAGDGDVGVNLAQLFINATYAVKAGEGRAAGVSVIGAYQRFSAQGIGSFAGYSTDAANLSNNGSDTGSGFGLKFGVQDQVGPGLSFGMSYQTEIKMSKFDKYAGLFADQGDFDIPATITFGFAFKPGTSSVVTVDWQKIYYSDVPAIANPIGGLLTGCATGADQTQCLGGSNGAGFGWEDMSILKLGYQWSYNPSMVWRVGYSKGDQPIPSSEVLFNILAPAVIEEHLTFGFTKMLGKQSELNFAFMYAKENSVSGGNAFTGGAQNIELKMSQYELEASWSKKF